MPKGISLASLDQAKRSDDASSGAMARYQRSAFGHGWDDADGDCRNSRAEALIASSTTQVHFATDRGCRVVAGRWVSAFTGNVIQNASNIDIDHVVPLAWSWDRGAREWPGETRLRFANDPVNLLPVEACLNLQGR
ncbi:MULTISPECIES: HNH endonuclease family protein [unclassified Marinobacter]|uniref:HNH endonuclease family protein n=1 Tax=unclassified Marinobacter TaxID=83889 RepID=UPI001D186324|nr:MULTISPECIES: HNH endonuclease family protein [unclassified Marinobacter]MEC9387828.1 HNH endonuclease family protein [Pseudomonadota bacterium]